jgi:hypothetical protein
LRGGANSRGGLALDVRAIRLATRGIGATQESFAKAIGVSVKALRNWEQRVLRGRKLSNLRPRGADASGSRERGRFQWRNPNVAIAAAFAAERGAVAPNCIE